MGYLTITAGNKKTEVETSHDSNHVDAIVGDFWKNDHCFIAVENADAGANESYALYDASAQRDAISFTGSVELTNPDFLNSQVVNSYRDAARTYTETLCYGEAIETPYVCEKAELLTDRIEKAKECKESGECSSLGLVARGSREPLRAKVSSKKAFALEKTESGFNKTGAYLIRNDVIKLLDFDDHGPKLRYLFLYRGKSQTTRAWIDADDLALINHR
ncbi:hypothetical protein [Salinisphaera sp. C84B14]|uniref:hypothetical protein n=1 Tax=Salinisphaera sp. C84B14 TaxID=1304155 RepID=UPI00333EC3D3